MSAQPPGLFFQVDFVRGTRQERLLWDQVSLGPSLRGDPLQSESSTDAAARLKMHLWFPGSGREGGSGRCRRLWGWSLLALMDVAAGRGIVRTAAPLGHSPGLPGGQWLGKGAWSLCREQSCPGEASGAVQSLSVGNWSQAGAYRAERSSQWVPGLARGGTVPSQGRKKGGEAREPSPQRFLPHCPNAWAWDTFMAPGWCSDRLLRPGMLLRVLCLWAAPGPAAPEALGGLSPHSCSGQLLHSPSGPQMCLGVAKDLPCRRLNSSAPATFSVCSARCP